MGSETLRGEGEDLSFWRPGALCEAPSWENHTQTTP